MPIGFISDHMEVIFDLDTEAAATAARARACAFARAATAGVHPAFVDRAGGPDGGARRGGPRRAVEQPVMPGGEVGWYACLPGCCVNLRQPDRPALCQVAGAL